MKRIHHLSIFIGLITIYFIFFQNAFAGDHEAYTPRTPAGGAYVSSSFLFDVATTVKYDSWIRLRTTESTNTHYEYVTETTSYDSSGNPTGLTVSETDEDYSTQYKYYYNKD